MEMLLLSIALTILIILTVAYYVTGVSMSNDIKYLKKKYIYLNKEGCGLREYFDTKLEGINLILAMKVDKPVKTTTLLVEATDHQLGQIKKIMES